MTSLAVIQPAPDDDEIVRRYDDDRRLLPEV